MNLDLLAWIAFCLAALPCGLFLLNLCAYRPPRFQAGHPLSKAVSVLIPARNEELHIRATVTSVLANLGVEFEVIVLDDQSSDCTAAIVADLAARDGRVRLEKAPPLPPGWCGKQHACQVLAGLARHELLVFLDADVQLQPEALARMCAFMDCQSHFHTGHPHDKKQGRPLIRRPSRSAREGDLSLSPSDGERVGVRGNSPGPTSAHSGFSLGHFRLAEPCFEFPALASGVPRQQLGTFSEQLLLPLIHFVLLGFLPMHLMRWSRWSAFGAGCGQLFIARAEAYRQAGGHARIRTSLHDGIKLPQAFRHAGFRTELFDATDLAVCRMYQTTREVWRGLGKNATEGLAAPATIGPMTLLLLGGQVLPLVLLLCAPWLEYKTIMVALGAVLLSYLPRLVAAWRFRQPLASALLHPVGILALLAIQWLALWRALNGQPAQWKGRSYAGWNTRPAPEPSNASG